MPNLIDLSIPIRHGDGRLGLEVAFSTPYSYENSGWQGSSFHVPHGVHDDGVKAGTIIA